MSACRRLWPGPSCPTRSLGATTSVHVSASALRLPNISLREPHTPDRLCFEQKNPAAGGAFTQLDTARELGGELGQTLSGSRRPHRASLSRRDGHRSLLCRRSALLLPEGSRPGSAQTWHQWARPPPHAPGKAGHGRASERETLRTGHMRPGPRDHALLPTAALLR